MSTHTSGKGCQVEETMDLTPSPMTPDTSATAADFERLALAEVNNTNEVKSLTPQSLFRTSTGDQVKHQLCADPATQNLGSVKENEMERGKDKPDRKKTKVIKDEDDIVFVRKTSSDPSTSSTPFSAVSRRSIAAKTASSSHELDKILRQLQASRRALCPQRWTGDRPLGQEDRIKKRLAVTRHERSLAHPGPRESIKPETQPSRAEGNVPISAGQLRNCSSNSRSCAQASLTAQLSPHGTRAREVNPEPSAQRSQDQPHFLPTSNFITFAAPETPSTYIGLGGGSQRVWNGEIENIFENGQIYSRSNCPTTVTKPQDARGVETGQGKTKATKRKECNKAGLQTQPQTRKRATAASKKSTPAQKGQQLERHPQDSNTSGKRRRVCKPDAKGKAAANPKPKPTPKPRSKAAKGSAQPARSRAARSKASAKQTNDDSGAVQSENATQPTERLGDNDEAAQLSFLSSLPPPAGVEPYFISPESHINGGAVSSNIDYNYAETYPEDLCIDPYLLSLRG